jgi:adenosine kinase
VLITSKGKNRSLVANLSAANNFKVSHVEKHWSVVENAKFFYSSGFFLTVSPESILKVGQYAAQSNKLFLMNLSAPFLCQFFKDPMLKCLAYADIIFGNESEALAFAENNQLGTKDISEIALKLSQWEKVNENRSRIAVITQGNLPFSKIC